MLTDTLATLRSFRQKYESRYPSFAVKALHYVDAFYDDIEYRLDTAGGIDQLWFTLSQQADFNPVCCSTYTFKGKMTVDKLRVAMEEQMQKFPKYRQRIEGTERRLHGAVFKDDPFFSLDHHITTINLAGNHTKAELEDAVASIVIRPWDLKKPLWEAVLVENYSDEDGAQSAMIMRAHHALADGQGFVISQLYVTSYRKELEKMIDGGAKKLSQARRGQLKPSEAHPALKPFDKYAKSVTFSFLLQLLLFSLFWTSTLVLAFVDSLWSFLHAIHTARLFLMSTPRSFMVTPYSSSRVKEREYASSKQFSIADIKVCQKAYSGVGNLHGGINHITLNDICCSLMADVLAEEMEANTISSSNPVTRFVALLNRYIPPPIGFFIPISVRKPGQWDMRNLSTGSIAYLSALRSDSPSSRSLKLHLASNSYELSILKRSFLPAIFFHLIQLTAQLPKLWITKWGTAKALESFQAILTNVPGPQKNVHIQGVEVLRWNVIPPQAGKGTLGIGIISYNNNISIAVVADKTPETAGATGRICKRFEERFEKVYLETAKSILSHQVKPKKL